MSGIHFGNDLFDEFARVQRQMASLLGERPSGIRAGRAGAFPALNVGATDDAIEIVAFAPGMAAADFDVSIDKDLLTISGERNRRRAPKATTCAPMHRSAFTAHSAAWSNCRAMRTPTRSAPATKTAAC